MPLAYRYGYYSDFGLNRTLIFQDMFCRVSTCCSPEITGAVVDVPKIT